MRQLLSAAAIAVIASLSLATAADAASVAFGILVVTQIDPENTNSFNDRKVGTKFGLTTVCDSVYCGPIGFSTDGGVANGTANGVTAPLGDTSNYLWGTNGENGETMSPLTSGVTVTFPPKLLPRSFNFYWGSIDAANGIGFNNTLTVQFLGGVFGIVTGSQLVTASKEAKRKVPVNGMGAATANDNQWFDIGSLSDLPIVAFNASSTKKAFEFDMAAPEPSTWAMLLIGFAGLGYTGYRSARRLKKRRLDASGIAPGRFRCGIEQPSQLSLGK
jgi:hypothetical protein